MTQQQQRRSLKNVTMTTKYHMLYMGPSIFLSLCLLVLLYASSVYHIYRLGQLGPEVPVQMMLVVATLVATLLGILLVGSGVLAAHRISGVHIKLANVLNQVREGDLSTRVYFRNTDKLEDVQDAFNNMMETLEKRIEKAEGTSSQVSDETPDDPE